MTKEVVNTHQALAILKGLEARIYDALSEMTVCLPNKNNNDKIKGVSIDETKVNMKASYDKVNDLIKRRNAIKRAVVLSNAKTMVKIAGVEYTVAEAIEMKNHGVEYKKTLLSNMKNQYMKAQKKIESENANVDDRAEKYVIGLFGATEKKVANDEIEKAKNAFLQQNQYSLIDPLKVLDKINELEAEIAAFEAEVDSAISTSNALTTIEVEY